MTFPGHDPLIDELAPGVLLDTADEARRARLASLLAASPENRRRFVDHAVLHGMLAREARAGAFAENPELFFRRLENTEASEPKSLLRFWLPAAAAAALVLFFTFSFLPNRAEASIDRVIQAMERVLDRTYSIQVIEPGPDPAPARTDRGRFPPANHLDGATLWLRGEGEFVLRQSLPNGQTRIIGADRARSWSMRGDGPARISDDPARFGRAVADGSGDIVFIDPRARLADLKRLYHLEWLERPSAGCWKLVGKRRSPDQGGPREIEVWFQPDSGLLERLILRQMPRANGGPRSLAIILRSTEPLPPDFFAPAHPR